MTQRERIQRYLLERVEIKVPSECWRWSKFRNRDGYGWCRYNKEYWRAHKLAYAAFVEEIPDGMQVLHRCDVPACCNPAHLYLGTHADNMRDKAKRDRVKSKKLTDDQVREIRALYRTGKYTQYEIAQLYEVNRRAIGRICDFTRRPHVL